MKNNFLKILSLVLCFGMICFSAFAADPPYDKWDAEWDDEVFRVIASHTPKDLDECCLALDDALRNKGEIKEKIKHSSDGLCTSYLRYISNTHTRVGYRISHHWLYLPEPRKAGKSCRCRPSPLADLLYAHGVDFDGEDYLMMVSIIFENYRYYLNNGKSMDCSIEDMAINHRFDFYRRFDHDFKREELERRMERWKNRKSLSVKSSPWWCIIM